MGQGSRPVVKAQLPALIFIEQEQKLFGAKGKQVVFIPLGHLLRAEYMLADDQHGLLAHLLPVVGQTA